MTLEEPTLNLRHVPSSSLRHFLHRFHPFQLLQPIILSISTHFSHHYLKDSIGKQALGSRHGLLRWLHLPVEEERMRRLDVVGRLCLLHSEPVIGSVRTVHQPATQHPLKPAAKNLYTTTFFKGKTVKHGKTIFVVRCFKTFHAKQKRKSQGPRLHEFELARPDPSTGLRIVVVASG